MSVARDCNELRRRLDESARPLVGAILNFPSERLTEFVGLAGFDWIMLDGEHDAIGPADAYGLSAVARSVGLLTVARAPACKHEHLGPYADAGVDGIVAPHVRTIADAQTLLEAMWFPPHGRRGMATLSRAAGYGILGPASDYVDNAALRPVPIAMFEDVDVYEHVEEIANLPGFEVAFLGPGDLSASINLPARVTDPQVTALIDKGIEALHRAGRKVIMTASDEASAGDAVRRGADMVVIYIAKLLGPSMKAFAHAARQAAVTRGAALGA